MNEDIDIDAPEAFPVPAPIERGTLRGSPRGKGTPKIAAHASRLTVIGKVYHQRHGGHDPRSASLAFTRLSANAGQPYEREVEIGEDWTAIDTGWIETPGLILVSNTAKHAPAKKPEPGGFEWPADSVEIGVDPNNPATNRDQYSPLQLPPVPFTIVPPGEVGFVSPLSPEDAKRLRIRSRSGTVPVTIRAFSS